MGWEVSAALPHRPKSRYTGALRPAQGTPESGQRNPAPTGRRQAKEEITGLTLVDAVITFSIYLAHDGKSKPNLKVLFSIKGFERFAIAFKSPHKQITARSFENAFADRIRQVKLNGGSAIVAEPK